MFQKFQSQSVVVPASSAKVRTAWLGFGGKIGIAVGRAAVERRMGREGKEERKEREGK